jgi:hypothetical protein
LQGLRQLELLDLQNTAVTDRGLVHLHGFRRASFDLGGTKVTEAGITALKEKLGDRAQISH